MSPPAAAIVRRVAETFSDIPPGVERVIKGLQTQLKLQFACIGGLATGLVALTAYCLGH